MNSNNEYQDIIETLDRIIGKLDRMNERLDMVREIIDDISSEKLIDDAVTSMNERHLSSTMYGVDNEQ